MVKLIEKSGYISKKGPYNFKIFQWSNPSHSTYPGTVIAWICPFFFHFMSEMSFLRICHPTIYRWAIFSRQSLKDTSLIFHHNEVCDRLVTVVTRTSEMKDQFRVLSPSFAVATMTNMTIVLSEHTRTVTYEVTTNLPVRLAHG